MNNFKKFAAVLLGVVMACVFATSAFAADFNKPNNAKRARAGQYHKLSIYKSHY